MKKWITIMSILVLSVLLAACTPAQSTETTDDLVSTQVSIILTETALSQPFETELPPTETLPLPPTETETPIEPPPTEEPAPTATATPVEDQNDPATLLGAPAWTYDFSGASSPWDFDSQQATFSTENGTLNLTAKANANWHSWYVSSPLVKNAYVETTIQMPNCAGLDRFGFIVRAGSDGQQFYFMGITCDGQWGFFRMEPDVKIQSVISYRTEEQLTKALNQPHRLGIWMKNSEFTFYIDGKEIGNASDTELTAEGYTGFLIAFANTPGFTVKVDNLQYWNVP